MDLTAELRTIAGVSNVSTPGGRDLSPKSQDNPLTVMLDLQNPERCYYCGMLRPGSNVCDTCRKDYGLDIRIRGLQAALPRIHRGRASG